MHKNHKMKMLNEEKKDRLSRLNRWFRIGVRWLVIEKHGRELLSWPELIKSC